MKRKHPTEDKIVDYIIDELTTEQLFQVRAHLKNCHTCAQLYQHWKEVLQTETNSVPSQHLKQAIFTSLSREKSKPIYKSPFIVGSFAIIILLVIGVFQWTNGNPPLSEQDSFVSVNDKKDDVFIEILINEATHSFTPRMTDFTWTTHPTISHEHYQHTFSEEFSFIPEKELLLMIDQPAKSQIIFVTEKALCIYRLQEKEFVCLPIKIAKDSTTYLPIPFNP